MGSLTCPNSKHKIRFLSRKFLSSIAVAESPPEDPIHFLNRLTRSRKCTVKDVKIFHAHYLKTNVFRSEVFVANSLVDGYVKCSHMNYALHLFDQIPHPNPISWNIMISGYNQNSLFEDSWRMFCRLHFCGSEANEITYGSTLSACSALQSPLYGKLVYSFVVKNGFLGNGFVRSGMIYLFSRYCSLDDALRVFYDVSCGNVACWNAIISGAVRNGKNWVALDLFRQMCRGSLAPNSFTFSSILTACAALAELELGKMVQGWVIKCGIEDVFVGTSIIDLYCKCGDTEEAVKEFSRMPFRNAVSVTAIISGVVQKGDSIPAIQFFKEVRKLREDINNYTVTSVLSACANPDMFKEAIQMHCWILKTGFYSDSAVRASVANVYSKIGEVDLAEAVFEETNDLKHLGTWAVMISAFAQKGAPAKAINVFQRMFKEGLRPDKMCISSVLSIVDSLILGRQIHCYALKAGLVFDVFVGSSLFTTYSKCGSLLESYEVFLQISERDNASWASMISGFAEHGHAYRAIELFREMLFEKHVPDKMTLAAVLTACSAICSVKTGMEVHAYALRRTVGSQILAHSALVSMYSKHGAFDMARRVFNMMPVKDQISYSCLVSGYAKTECIEDAIALFREMQMTDIEVDSFTLSSVLGAVAYLNRRDIGSQLHGYIVKAGLESEVSVGSSLVMMYSKCGSIDDCQRAFHQITEPDLVCWTAMIVSYAQHGKGAEALRSYALMRELEIQPDAVTFVGVLSACSHTGLVEEGYLHLNSMVKDFGIEPTDRHYACMVDVLGRSGRLEEAEKFIRSMPIKPSALVWATLLASCRMHGEIQLGRIAARKVMELEPNDDGAYVSLSNIYADIGQWGDVQKIRHAMRGTGVNKEPGWSSI